jgi:hypothetical protein
MKGFIAVVAAVAATVLAPSALAGNDHRTLGPAGYDTPGKSALVLAGTGGVELGSGDHVVICHAIGGAKGDRFNQIAPSAGVVYGHNGHEGDRDIIPPYTYVDNKGVKDTSLAAGNNWSGANIAIYNEGCREPRKPEGPPEQPKDECPNIAGNQNSVPAGLVKDSNGNCVQPHHQPPTDACPNLEGFQSSIPAGFVRDSSGNCVCPPTTVTVHTVPQAVPLVAAVSAAPQSVIKTTTPKAKKKAKKKVKVKAKKKAKKVKKKAKKKARLPRVLPFTR